MNRTVLLTCLLLCACSENLRTHPPHQMEPETGWTEEQRGAYEKCLEDNMAVATAWEIIEERCAASVDHSDDPLGAS